MPILKDIRKTIIIELPSFPESKVELYKGILFGQMKELEKENSEFKRGILTLQLLIKDWNFTDEEGNKLPFNEKSFDLLPSEDLTLLLNKVAEFFKVTEKKTKESLKK